MAFFCDISGARLMAPGTGKSAGGSLPEHDGSPLHDAAEEAALAALTRIKRSATELSPAGTALEHARAAALETLTRPEGDAKPKAPPGKLPTK